MQVEYIHNHASSVSLHDGNGKYECDVFVHVALQWKESSSLKPILREYKYIPIIVLIVAFELDYIPNPSWNWNTSRLNLCLVLRIHKFALSWLTWARTILKTSNILFTGLVVLLNWRLVVEPNSEIVCNYEFKNIEELAPFVDIWMDCEV